MRRASIYRVAFLVVVMLSFTACAAKPATTPTSVLGSSGGETNNSSSPGLPTATAAAQATSTSFSTATLAASLTPTSIPTATAEALSASGSPAEALLAAMKAQLDAKAYRTKTIVKESDGSNASEIDAAFVAPDNYDITTSGSEFVITGGKTYLKDPTGKWGLSPVDMGSIISSFRNTELMDNFSKYVSDVQRVGTDTIDGKSMTIYSYKTDFEGITGTARIWIGADNLPYKQEGNSTFQGKTYMTSSTYTYDLNITIPKPDVQ